MRLKTAAIFSFADTPEHQRPGVSLFIDEFQHFSTPDISELFTEGRKFGLRLMVAHQYRSQLPPYLQAATMTARNKICFQTTPEDSREVSPLFMGGEATVRPEDIDPRPVEHLLRYGSDYHDIQTFVGWYLLRLEHQKEGGHIEIKRRGFPWGDVPSWVLNVKPSEEMPKVPDPTPFLNHLLYQVMKTGNADVYIPSEVVWGFSNSGRGFYSVFRWPFVTIQ